jgi:hypothetical protein
MSPNGSTKKSARSSGYRDIGIVRSISYSRNLYTLGYSSDRIRELFRLIDWMMRLPSVLDRRFKAELVAYEEEMQMPYVTSVERLGKEEGIIKGQEQGSAILLLRQLTHICGILSEEVEQEIRTLSLE